MIILVEYNKKFNHDMLSEKLKRYSQIYVTNKKITLLLSLFYNFQ